MGETIELASTVLSVGISTQGMGRDIVSAVKGVGGQIGGIGRSAGADFKNGFERSAAGATRSVESDVQRLERAVADSARKVKAARQSEGDAARKVAIEEAKLQELRDSGKAKASQILAAEDRVTSARQRQAIASDKVNIEARKFVAAQREVKAATDQAAQSADRAGDAASGFGGKLRSAFGRIQNPFGPIVDQADDAGRRAADQFSDKMRSGTRSLGKSVGSSLKAGLVGALAAVSIGGIVSGIKGVVTAGSDLEQSIGGVSAVFKKHAGEIGKAAMSAATDVGMSANEYNTLATTLGAGLKNKGIKQFSGETQKLIKLGSDLAAQFGGSTTDAVDAIGSLMRGEADPIERYGVAINDTAIKAELAAKGQSKLTGQALETAKTQARLSILFRQTADAQGAFGREADTFAGKQQRAQAQWKTLTEQVGLRFLPTMTEAMDFVSTRALPAIDGFTKGVGDAVAGFKGFDFSFGLQQGDPEFLRQVGDGFKGIGEEVSRFQQVAMPILIEVWNYIVTKWGELQPQVQSIWGNIKMIFLTALEIIRAAIQGTTTQISAIWQAWGPTILGVIGGIMKAVAGIFDGFLMTVGGILKVLSGMLTGDTQKIMEGVRLIFDGQMKAIGSLIGGAVDVFGSVWGGIKKVFADPINWVISNAINPLVRAINDLGKTFGLNLNIPTVALLPSAPATGGGGAKGSARALRDGGPVPGYSPSDVADNIPIWATADEYMIRRRSARKLRQRHGGLLDYMNAHGDLPPGYGPARYAGGGRIVANATQGFRGYDPKALGAMQAWAAATDRVWYMTGNGGARSFGDQLRAWNLYQSGRGPLAANPYRGGPHMYPAVAMDLSPRPGDIPAARSLLGAYGLGLTVPGEPWHVGWTGGRSGGQTAGGFDAASLLSGLVKAIPKLTLPGVLGDTLNSIPGWIAGKAADALAKKIGGYAGGTSWASPGVALVAERGPELVTRRSLRSFRGGETVYDAQDTAALLGGGRDMKVIVYGDILDATYLDRLQKGQRLNVAAAQVAAGIGIGGAA